MKVVEHRGCSISVKNVPMPLFELNSSVENEDAERLSKQQKAVYRLFLKFGRVSTAQLAKTACQYNSRVKEIRKWLELQGKTIKLVEKGENGNNWYEIVELDNA